MKRRTRKKAALAGYWAGAIACGLFFVLLAAVMLTAATEGILSAILRTADDDVTERPATETFPLEDVALLVLWAAVAAQGFRFLLGTIRDKEREW